MRLYVIKNPVKRCGFLVEGGATFSIDEYCEHYILCTDDFEEEEILAVQSQINEMAPADIAEICHYVD